MSLLKTVVITGASRGLGLEFVKQLASTPSCQTLVASCRNPESAQDLWKIKESCPEKIHVLKLDVNDILSFGEFFDKIEVIYV